MRACRTREMFSPQAARAGELRAPPKKAIFSHRIHLTNTQTGLLFHPAAASSAYGTAFASSRLAKPISSDSSSSANLSGLMLISRKCFWIVGVRFCRFLYDDHGCGSRMKRPPGLRHAWARLKRVSSPSSPKLRWIHFEVEGRGSCRRSEHRGRQHRAARDSADRRQNCSAQM